MSATLPLRYLDVPLKGGHYESVYTLLTHPTEPQALWIRTTVKKKPGHVATGALWVTWFGPEGVRAGKVNDVPVAGTGLGITCGTATQGPAGTRGTIQVPGLQAAWDVVFEPDDEPLHHLAPALYKAPLPKTKATSPLPDLTARGTLSVDGASTDLTGWTGMLGHNWGTEHAARWIWLRAAGLGEDGSGWLDAILGRVRVGPVLVPWTGFGCLSLDGTRHRLGGLLNRGSAVELRPDGATITLTGDSIRVVTTATLDPARSVAWEYADPSGHRHEVVNSSVVTTSLAVTRPGSARTLRPKRHGVLEVGGDVRAFDVPLQDYAD